ncbi:hypothetical protein EMCRGX_G020105 [Ephydatia muelleri]
MKRTFVEEKLQALASKKAKTTKHGRAVNELMPTENKEKPLQLTDSSKPKTGEANHYTVSIALPGSIVDGVLLPELKTYLAGQIGRLAAVFCVDEIVVFNEAGCTNQATLVSETSKNSSAAFLSRVLQYLETPQYLRKMLFPLHPDLKFAGLLNPLDCSHHVKAEEEVPYREGVVLDRPTSAERGSFVECGLKKNVRVDKHIQPGVRVTVMMERTLKKDPKYFVGKVVSPSIPRMEAGTYWGYRVRFAHSLGAIFTESPFEGGYDLSDIFLLSSEVRRGLITAWSATRTSNPWYQITQTRGSLIRHHVNTETHDHQEHE